MPALWRSNTSIGGSICHLAEEEPGTRNWELETLRSHEAEAEEEVAVSSPPLW